MYGRGQQRSVALVRDLEIPGEVHLISLCSAKILMAERVGFEPTVEFPQHTLSKRAP